MIALVGCGGKKSTDTVTKDGLFFDTVISLSVTHEEGEALLEECFSLCAEYEDIFSRTKETSELYKLNHRTSNTVEVSDELAELIALGLEYGQLSGGVFDITIAPVSDLWDFKSEDPQIPPKADIEEALKKVDASKVHVNGNQILFDSPDTMIDLGAIVKGWAADQLKGYLVSEGVTSGMINLGGNVLAIGPKPDNTPWNVGIQKPFADRNVTADVMETIDSSVVSSGTYERYFKKGGKLYHHILDPKTGYPVETDLSQVTILSEKSVTGDLYSTICMLLGYQRAQELVEETPEIEAVFVLDDGTLEEETD